MTNINFFLRLLFICLFANTYLKSQTFPGRFLLNTESNDSIMQNGLSSNVVAEIRLLGDSLTWFGTGRGLAVHDGSNVLTYKTFLDSIVDGQESFLLPQGGIPAISVLGDTMLVAFSGDDGDIQMGLGLAISFSAQDTTGITWKLFDQPMDGEPDSIDLIGGLDSLRNYQLQLLKLTLHMMRA